MNTENNSSPSWAAKRAASHGGIIRRPVRKATWSDYLLMLIIVPIIGAACGLGLAILMIGHGPWVWKTSPDDPGPKIVLVFVPLACAVIAEWMLIRSILLQRSGKPDDTSYDD